MMRSGGLLREHGADLHGGGLRAHEAAAAGALAVESQAGREAVLLQIERVLLVARRVVERRIERIKVEDLILDVGPISEREPEPAENLDGAIADLEHRVERAGRIVAAGQRGVEIGRLGGSGELCLARVEGGGDGVLGLVHGFADDRLLVFRHRAHLLEQLRETAAASEVLDAHGLERIGIGGAGDGGKDFGFEGGDFVEHEGENS